MSRDIPQVQSLQSIDVCNVLLDWIDGLSNTLSSSDQHSQAPSQSTSAKLALQHLQGLVVSDVINSNTPLQDLDSGAVTEARNALVSDPLWSNLVSAMRNRATMRPNSISAALTAVVDNNVSEKTVNDKNNDPIIGINTKTEQDITKTNTITTAPKVEPSPNSTTVGTPVSTSYALPVKMNAVSLSSLTQPKKAAVDTTQSSNQLNSTNSMISPSQNSQSFAGVAREICVPSPTVEHELSLFPNSSSLSLSNIVQELNGLILKLLTSFQKASKHKIGDLSASQAENTLLLDLLKLSEEKFFTLVILIQYYASPNAICRCHKKDDVEAKPTSDIAFLQQVQNSIQLLFQQMFLDIMVMHSDTDSPDQHRNNNNLIRSFLIPNITTAESPFSSLFFSSSPLITYQSALYSMYSSHLYSPLNASITATFPVITYSNSIPSTPSRHEAGATTWPVLPLTPSQLSALYSQFQTVIETANFTSDASLTTSLALASGSRAFLVSSSLPALLCHPGLVQSLISSAFYYNFNGPLEIPIGISREAALSTKQEILTSSNVRSARQNALSLLALISSDHSPAHQRRALATFSAVFDSDITPGGPSVHPVILPPLFETFPAKQLANISPLLRTPLGATILVRIILHWVYVLVTSEITQVETKRKTDMETATTNNVMSDEVTEEQPSKKTGKSNQVNTCSIVSLLFALFANVAVSHPAARLDCILCLRVIFHNLTHIVSEQETPIQFLVAMCSLRLLIVLATSPAPEVHTSSDLNTDVSTNPIVFDISGPGFDALTDLSARHASPLAILQLIELISINSTDLTSSVTMARLCAGSFELFSQSLAVMVPSPALLFASIRLFETMISSCTDALSTLHQEMYSDDDPIPNRAVFMASLAQSRNIIDTLNQVNVSFQEQRESLFFSSSNQLYDQFIETLDKFLEKFLLLRTKFPISISDVDEDDMVEDEKLSENTNQSNENEISFSDLFDD